MEINLPTFNFSQNTLKRDKSLDSLRKLIPKKVELYELVSQEYFYYKIPKKINNYNNHSLQTTQNKFQSENNETLNPSRMYIPTSPFIRKASKSPLSSSRSSERDNNSISRGGIIQFKQMKQTNSNLLKMIVLIQRYWRSKLYKNNSINKNSHISNEKIFLPPKQKFPKVNNAITTPIEKGIKEIKTQNVAIGQNRSMNIKVNIINISSEYKEQMKKIWNEENKIEKNIEFILIEINNKKDEAIGEHIEFKENRVNTYSWNEINDIKNEINYQIERLETYQRWIENKIKHNQYEIKMQNFLDYNNSEHYYQDKLLYIWNDIKRISHSKENNASYLKGKKESNYHSESFNMEILKQKRQPYKVRLKENDILIKGLPYEYKPNKINRIQYPINDTLLENEQINWKGYKIEKVNELFINSINSNECNNINEIYNSINFDIGSKIKFEKLQEEFTSQLNYIITPKEYSCFGCNANRWIELSKVNNLDSFNYIGLIKENESNNLNPSQEVNLIFYASYTPINRKLNLSELSMHFENIAPLTAKTFNDSECNTIEQNINLNKQEFFSIKSIYNINKKNSISPIITIEAQNVKNPNQLYIYYQNKMFELLSKNDFLSQQTLKNISIIKNDIEQQNNIAPFSLLSIHQNELPINQNKCFSLLPKEKESYSLVSMSFNYKGNQLFEKWNEQNEIELNEQLELNIIEDKIPLRVKGRKNKINQVEDVEVEDNPINFSINCQQKCIPNIIKTSFSYEITKPDYLNYNNGEYYYQYKISNLWKNNAKITESNYCINLQDINYIDKYYQSKILSIWKAKSSQCKRGQIEIKHQKEKNDWNNKINPCSSNKYLSITNEFKTIKKFNNLAPSYSLISLHLQYKKRKWSSLSLLEKSDLKYITPEKEEYSELIDSKENKELHIILEQNIEFLTEQCNEGKCYCRCHVIGEDIDIMEDINSDSKNQFQTIPEPTMNMIVKATKLEEEAKDFNEEENLNILDLIKKNNNKHKLDQVFDSYKKRYNPDRTKSTFNKKVPLAKTKIVATEINKRERSNNRNIEDLLRKQSKNKRKEALRDKEEEPLI